MTAAFSTPRKIFLAAALAAVALAAVLGLAALGGDAAGRPPATAALVRVDQLGFAPGERKVAYLMGGPAGATRFAVLDDGGHVVLRGNAGQSRGSWNASYPNVRPLDLTALQATGSYRVRAAGAVSPPFRIAPAAQLFGPRVADTVAFFTAQRDGANVIPGQLHRKPSHLHDSHARVYAWPRYVSHGSDVIVGRSLRRIGGPVDLEGGWFDAGDFIKFTHTTAYAETLLLAARRALGANAPASLEPETRFGLHWLDKAWNPKSGVMYIQVGIGSGNRAGTFRGDHDLWRLPQRDDSLEGSQNRYLRNRPAFRANKPGRPVPPNHAGRVAAAYALAAQDDAQSNPTRARAELDRAARVYAAAKTRHVRHSDVVTALPHAFYPESSWRDDLELGGAELALAGQALGDPRAGMWLHDSARWARAYLRREAGEDTFNLYDTSALADSDLVRAMRAARNPGRLAVTEADLIGELRAQLDRAVARADHDPFDAGAIYDDFDAAPHTFGLIVTASLYRELTGDDRYDAFATAQRDWALGDNAWGVSLMVGVGTTFPDCMQHVVANLSGSLDGSPPLVRGAVVNGPNDAGLFSGGLGGRLGGMRQCPPGGGDRYKRFTGHGSRFVDDVRSWQTVEPALDFDAAAALAFALER